MDNPYDDLDPRLMEMQAETDQVLDRLEEMGLAQFLKGTSGEGEHLLLMWNPLMFLSVIAFLDDVRNAPGFEDAAVPFSDVISALAEAWFYFRYQDDDEQPG